MLAGAPAIVVRPLSQADIADAVAVHLAAFEGFFLSSLGERFLRKYYRQVLAYRGRIWIGAVSDGALAGFVAGFMTPNEFYKGLRSARVRFAMAALPAVVAKPWRLGRLFVNYRRIGQFARVPGEDTAVAELASLAVDPRCEGMGIGASLVRAFTREVAVRGGDSVVLTTDADGNDRVNEFYVRLGFRLQRRFEAQPGRYLNEYRMHLVDGPTRDGAAGLADGA